MVCTISTDLLKNIGGDELVYFSDLLMVFAHKQNDHKVTQDHEGVVIDKYTAVTENLEYIATWLKLMSFSPSSFEKINIDVDQETKDCDESFFIELCKATKGEKNLVVYSMQNIDTVDLEDNKINCGGYTIDVLDRDAAKAIVSVNTVIKGDFIKDSQVAKGKGKISKSKIKKKNGG